MTLIKKENNQYNNIYNIHENILIDIYNNYY